MRRKRNGQAGFTLIEMIVVIIIVGILAAGTAMGIVIGVQGYVLSRDNAAITEKAQLAIARINRELIECYNCSATSGSVAMPIVNNLGPRYIRFNAGNIEISPNGTTYDTLLDNVQSLSMTYYYDATGHADGSIDVTIVISRPGGNPITFSTKVLPRNT